MIREAPRGTHTSDYVAMRVGLRRHPPDTAVATYRAHIVVSGQTQGVPRYRYGLSEGRKKLLAKAEGDPPCAG